jgi:hypothetical protein
MKSHTTKTLFCAAAFAALAGLHATASDLVSQARDIMDRNQASIINVTAMTKLDMGGTGLPMRIGGLGEAQETQCGGIVIDASGMTLVSYTALNPLERVSSAIRGRTGEDDDGLKSKTELSRVQIHLADGTEVPARLVLKDKELDLAFLVPDPKEGEKAPPFTPVKLSGAVAAKELDDVVVISRHTKDLGYQPTVTLGQVTSVIKKPRTMYDLSTPAQPGVAVYLPDGQLLGVSVVAGGEGGGLMAMGGMEVLVLPTSEIIKLADQARKAAEKKPAEPAKPEKK